MRPRVLFALIGVLGLISLSSPAHAGGATLDFEQKYYMPGDTVRGSGIVWLKPKGNSLGTLKDGPYFAYLSPTGSWKSRRDLVQVAELHITPRAGGEHGRVSVAFTLPNLESGYHWLRYCNEGCKKPLGDLQIQQLNVVADESEARVLDLSLRVAEDVSRVEARLSRKRSSLEKEVGRTIAGIEERLLAIEGRLKTLQQRDEAEGGEGFDGSLALLPAGVVLLMLGFLLGKAKHRA